jgi:curved DNA-binding protein CbpA
MKDKNNYYEILGVSKNAKAAKIKQAYRRAVLRNHPDLHPNDEKKQENMKRINEAYSVLGNPKRRAEYDRGTQSFENFTFNPYKNLAYMLLAWAECWFKYTVEINKLYLSIISLKHP